MESLEVLGERRTILSNKGRTQAPRGFTWVKSKEPVKTLKSPRYNQTNPLKTRTILPRHLNPLSKPER